MVAQYPHMMIIATLDNAPMQDENGNWLQDTGSTIQYLPCRAEPNGNSVITLPDGTQYRFAFKVFMPKGTPDIKAGVRVAITGLYDDALNGTVKLFYPGQLNCTAWL